MEGLGLKPWEAYYIAGLVGKAKLAGTPVDHDAIWRQFGAEDARRRARYEHLRGK